MLKGHFGRHFICLENSEVEKAPVESRIKNIGDRQVSNSDRETDNKNWPCYSVSAISLALDLEKIAKL